MLRSNIVYILLLSYTVYTIDQNCLSHILLNFCTKSDLLLYVYEEDFDASTLSDVKNRTILIYKLSQMNKDMFRKIDCVIFSNWQVVVNKTWLTLVHQSIRNDEVPVKIVFLHPYDEGVTGVFEVLLWNYFVDVILVAKSKVYSYFPLTNSDCDKAVPVDLGSCTEVTSWPNEGQVEVYSNCTLCMGAVQNEPFVDDKDLIKNRGFEVAILRIVVEKLNMRPEMILLSAKRTEAYDFIKLPAIGVGGFTSNQIFNLCFYYIDESVAIFTLEASPVEPWKNIVGIFDVATWSILFATAIFVLATFKFIVPTCDFTLILAPLASVPVVPPKLNKVFYIWSICTFIITSSYTGLMGSYLLISIKQQQPDNLQGMLDQNFKFRGDIFAQKTVLQNVNNPDLLKQSFSLCEIQQYDTCIKLIANRGFAFVGLSHEVAHHLKMLKMRRVHRSKLINVYVGMYVEDVWFKDKVQDCVLRLNEGGIVQYLDKYGWMEVTELSVESSPLTLNHLYFIFFLGAIGISVAVVVFFVELSCCRKVDSANIGRQ